MLTVDAAFERIGTALRQRQYSLVKEERPQAGTGDRVSVFDAPDMRKLGIWASFKWAVS